MSYQRIIETMRTLIALENLTIELLSTMSAKNRLSFFIAQVKPSLPQEP